MRIINDLLGTVAFRNASNVNSASEHADAFGVVMSKTLSYKPEMSEEARAIVLSKTREQMLALANANAEDAERLAFGYAHHALGHALLDVSDRPNIRYSATGELVTPKTERYFAAISQAMQQQCSALYRQEKSKGTAHAEILDRIFKFHDAMPKAFRSMLGM